MGGRVTMAAPGVLELPSIDDGRTKRGDHVVVVFNNDVNTFEEVFEILIVATNCSVEEAEMETWEVDQLGKSVVHQADREICEEIAEIIRTIGIRVEVHQE
ncbi:ATP-dependent Clp protease adaptor ClpS [bacterium]|nr:MAG: ATP-dependent Clp protease adaptor ClpS [bacterium]